MAYRFLLTRRDGPVEYLTLNRPEVRNAFNEIMIGELTAWADAMHAERSVRVAVLNGAGQAFSAGGDLAWMAKMVNCSREENRRDAGVLARLYERLNTLPVPLVGRVHGAALGGGSGLAAVCDVVVAERGCVFGFTEVKLGILPGVISPYVLAKIGQSAARELFLTGARFPAERARDIGLVHAVVDAAGMDAAVAGYIKEFLSAGPAAIAAAKAMIPKVAGATGDAVTAMTAEAIADMRVSPEGQEGLRAFLEKRRASWRQDS
jgi:methylglutaconyl-CoA hydratase